MRKRALALVALAMSGVLDPLGCSDRASLDNGDAGVRAMDASVPGRSARDASREPTEAASPGTSRDAGRASAPDGSAGEKVRPRDAGPTAVHDAAGGEASSSQDAGPSPPDPGEGMTSVCWAHRAFTGLRLGDCILQNPSQQETDSLSLALRSSDGLYRALPHLGAGAECRGSMGQGWYVSDNRSRAVLCPATCSAFLAQCSITPSEAQIDGSVCEAVSSSNPPPRLDFLFDPVACTDAGVLHGVVHSARIAQMSPTLPPVGVCARASASSDPWQLLTQGPLSYPHVSSYTRVPAADLDVKIVASPGTCDDAPLLTKTVHLVEQPLGQTPEEFAKLDSQNADFYAQLSTLLVTGRVDPDGNPSTNDSTLRLLAFPDMVSQNYSYIDQSFGIRMIQAVEGLPALDGRINADTGDRRQWPLAFDNLTYLEGVSDPPLPASTGFSAFDGLRIDPSPFAGYVQFTAGLPTTLALFDRASGELTSTWTPNLPEFLFNGAATYFAHGTSPADLGILACSDASYASSAGLSECVPFERTDDAAFGFDYSIQIVHLSPDVGAVDVCRKPSIVDSWDNVQKSAGPLRYGESIETRGADLKPPLIRLVPAGTSCASTPLVEASDPSFAKILALVGAAASPAGAPPLELLRLTPNSYLGLDAGMSNSDVTIVHAALELAAINVAAVDAGSFSEPSWPGGVAFGSNVERQFAPVSNLVFGLAPLGASRPSLVADQAIATQVGHSYAAYVMGVRGSTSTPVRILFCDQTLPLAPGPVPCTPLSLSP